MFAVERKLITGALPVAVKIKRGMLIYFSTLLFQLVSEDIPGSLVLIPLLILQYFKCIDGQKRIIVHNLPFLPVCWLESLLSNHCIFILLCRYSFCCWDET